MKKVWQFITLFYLIYGCQEERVIQVEINVIDHFNQPLKDVRVNISNDVETLTDAKGLASFELNIVGLNDLKIKASKLSEDFYYAPYFKKIDLGQTTTKLTLPIKLYAVPKYKNKENNLTESDGKSSDIEVVAKAPNIVRTEGIEEGNKHEKEDIELPELVPYDLKYINLPEKMTFKTTVKDLNDLSRNTEKKLDFSYSFYINHFKRPYKHPLNNAAVYFADRVANRVTRICMTQKNGMCIVLRNAKFPHNSIFFVRKKGYKSRKIEHSFDRKSSNFLEIGLKKGEIHDFNVIHEDLLGYHPVTDVDIFINKRFVGKTDVFGNLLIDLTRINRDKHALVTFISKKLNPESSSQTVDLSKKIVHNQIVSLKKDEDLHFAMNLRKVLTNENEVNDQKKFSHVVEKLLTNMDSKLLALKRYSQDLYTKKFYKLSYFDRIEAQDRWDHLPSMSGIDLVINTHIYPKNNGQSELRQIALNFKQGKKFSILSDDSKNRQIDFFKKILTDFLTSKQKGAELNKSKAIKKIIVHDQFGQKLQGVFAFFEDVTNIYSDKEGHLFLPIESLRKYKKLVLAKIGFMPKGLDTKKVNENDFEQIVLERTHLLIDIESEPKGLSLSQSGKNLDKTPILGLLPLPVKGDDLELELGNKFGLDPYRRFVSVDDGYLNLSGVAAIKPLPNYFKKAESLFHMEQFDFARKNAEQVDKSSDNYIKSRHLIAKIASVQDEDYQKSKIELENVILASEEKKISPEDFLNLKVDLSSVELKLIDINKIKKDEQFIISLCGKLDVLANTDKTVMSNTILERIYYNRYYAYRILHNLTSSIEIAKQVNQYYKIWLWQKDTLNKLSNNKTDRNTTAL